MISFDDMELEETGVEIAHINIDICETRSLLDGLSADGLKNMLSDLYENQSKSSTYLGDVEKIKTALIECFDEISFLNTDEQQQDEENNPSFSTIYLPNVSLLTQDQDGDTILHIAIARNDKHAVQHILNSPSGHAGIDMINNLGQTALHIAMYTGNIPCIDSLLQRDADINIFDAEGNNTPLHVACYEDSEEPLSSFLKYRKTFPHKYNIVINALNGEGLAPLHIAARNKNQKMMEMLLQHGADVDIQEGRSGKTILILALESALGSDPIVMMSALKLAATIATKYHPDVNITSYALYSPLHYACSLNAKEMVNILLQCDSDVGEKTVDRKTEKDLTTDRCIKGILDRRLRKKRKLRLSASITENG